MTEPQTIQLTVEFTVQHNPGNEAHLKQILDNYFRGKGVTFDVNEGKLII